MLIAPPMKSKPLTFSAVYLRAIREPVKMSVRWVTLTSVNIAYSDKMRNEF